jgi:CheY-like chemotaxis protein
MSNKLICIIDDDSIYQILVKKVVNLALPSYTVVSYKDGKEAIGGFKSGEPIPEIILVDIEMPHMDGWEFMEEMNSILDNPGIGSSSIYIVSSSISPEDIAKARHYSKITGFYSKPITTTTLLEIAGSNGVS